MTPEEDDEAAQREHEWLNHIVRDWLKEMAYWLVAGVCAALILAKLWLWFGG